MYIVQYLKKKKKNSTERYEHGLPYYCTILEMNGAHQDVNRIKAFIISALSPRGVNMLIKIIWR